MERVKIANPQYVHVEVPRPHYTVPLVLIVHVTYAFDGIFNHLFVEELVQVADEGKADAGVGKPRPWQVA